MAGGDLGDLLRRALGDDLTAAHATLGAEVDKMVSDLDNMKVMLRNDHGVTTLYLDLTDPFQRRLCGIDNRRCTAHTPPTSPRAVLRGTTIRR